LEDMKENIEEAERIRYCTKISKPGESGFQETPVSSGDMLPRNMTCPGNSKGKKKNKKANND